MNAVDTNILVRLLTRDDPKQTERAESFISNGAWVSHIVLVETVWVLESVFELDSKAIGTAVAMLLDHAQLSIQDPDVVESALSEFRRRRVVGFSDCLILESAKKAGHVPLGTFDKAFARIDGVLQV